jgi:hypothetical protein
VARAGERVAEREAAAQIDVLERRDEAVHFARGQVYWSVASTKIADTASVEPQ